MSSARILRACFGHAVRSRNVCTKPAFYAPVSIQMPALSPTMEEGTIIKWLLEEGDPVEVGDAMCEVETDKAVVTMESNEDGTLAKILVPGGTANVKINVPIAILAEEGEDIKEAAAMDVTSSSSFTQTSPTPPPESGTKIVPDVIPSSKTSLQLSPAVRQNLQHYDIESSKVTGTGPKGLILKGDVLKYIATNNIKAKNYVGEARLPSPATTKPKPSTTVKQTISEDNFVDLELSNVRKIIAKRLTESKQQIPHAYSSVDCAITKILTLRKELLREGIKFSVNDFIIKAAAHTLRQVPEVNSQLVDGAIEHMPTIDVSVAVATDGGLITPIIKNASSKGLSEIGAEIRELAGRAREGKLRPQEFQGGTFTISNLGMFGIREFTAVINPPQACIMAVGGTRLTSSPRLVDFDDDADVNKDKPDVQSVMTVTLSSDARVVDDELATKFLQTFKRNIENPLILGLL